MKAAYWAIVIVIPFIVGLLLYIQPDCLESHVEVTHVPARTELRSFPDMSKPWTGQGAPVSVTVEAYDYKVVVCDKWEE